jgi:hypothetical protein
VISWKLENDLFWSYNCNFPGNDIQNEPLSDGKFCGELCKQNPSCNHFVWTNVEVMLSYNIFASFNSPLQPIFFFLIQGQGGICWMKDNNIIKEKSAVLIPGSRGAICGILGSNCECVC